MSASKSSSSPPPVAASRSQVHFDSRPNSSRAPQNNNVLARLQALFPPQAQHSSVTRNAPSLSSTSSPSPSVPTSSTKASSPRPFIKVRIVSWNMHDSLPKGELDDLLGVVPPTEPAVSTHSSGWPLLPAEQGHPYHIVVVAGQECPGASGIPKALGTSLKRKDKEKHRDKDKTKDVDKSHTPDDEDADSFQKLHQSEPRPSERGSQNHLSVAPNPDDRNCDIHDPKQSRESERPPHDTPGHHHQSGWSSVLEEWYRHGTGNVRADSPGHPLEKSASPSTQVLSSTEVVNQQPRMTGTYELLEKDRLLGVYMAIYVHRDIKHLVRGVSKSSVTAGLMGGRVGNKGGVGISLNIDGTTLLFINAHLAAHGGKVSQRLTDWAKIKALLNVDDFLPSSDARVMAEDITDKFDYTFLLGDLNFRLDITRLHADWLISRSEYAQALAFDQLRGLMGPGGAFDGFEEGPIDFPPTFKYDVVRPNKFPKRSKSRRLAQQSPTDNDPNPSADVQEEEEDNEHEHDVDTASLMSSMVASARSRTTVDEYAEREDEELEGSTHHKTTASSGSIADKVWAAAAVHKAKTKWITFLTASLPKSPGQKRSKRRSRADSLASRVTDINMFASAEPSPTLADSMQDASDTHRPDSGVTGGDHRVCLPQSEQAVDYLDPEDRGVYDSSPKQRVPSWCDRILWKTTVMPEPEPEPEPALHTPSRNPMMHVLQALRPLSLRTRKDSEASAFSVDATRSSTSYSTRPSHEQHKREELVGTSVQSHGPPRLHLKRIDSLPSLMKPVLSRTISHEHTMLDDQGPSRGRASGGGVPMQHTLTLQNPSTSGLTPSMTTMGLQPLPIPSATSSQGFSGPRWLGFLPFLHRDTTINSTAHSETIPSEPCRGDVVCLEYRSLDNRAMRRLEGRSDHRPVIGSYAIYL